MINPIISLAEICRNYIILVTAVSSAPKINEFKITKQLVMYLPFIKSYWTLEIVDICLIGYTYDMLPDIGVIFLIFQINRNTLADKKLLNRYQLKNVTICFLA